jgi:hypothetical protein
MLLRDVCYALNVSLAAYPYDHQVVVEEFLKEMHWHRKHGNLNEREQRVTDRPVELAGIYLASATAARLAELQTAMRSAPVRFSRGGLLSDSASF